MGRKDMVIQEIELSVLNRELKDKLLRAAEEIEKRFGERFAVRHFYYEGSYPFLQSPQPAAEVFYFNRPGFMAFANDFIGMLVFPHSSGGCGERSVQVIADPNYAEDVPIYVHVHNKKYEPIVRGNLDDFAEGSNRKIEYS